MQIDASPRNIAMAGSLLLALGVFTPIVSLPLLGDVTFMQNGHGYGVLMLGAGIAGALLAHRGHRTGLLIAAGVAGAMMVSTFIGIQTRIQQLVDTIGGRPSSVLSGLTDVLVQSIQMQWGWGVLMFGVGLMLYGGAGMRKRV